MRLSRQIVVGRARKAIEMEEKEEPKSKERKVVWKPKKSSMGKNEGVG